ncbi:MAG: DUF1097 domain-containing protein [Thermoleophilia bacterium]|nr:DUF1097 domain-containing protein [Thermoleophilia bacterium]MDH3724365.1 DUF1097 domain-containing protein [Thermoleophilia bacterium]
MSARAKAILPLAVVIGVLSFLWTELSLNFTFHWVTQQDELFGPDTVGVPEHFHLILPTAFITWGLFFAAGGDNAAFGKIFIASIFGSVAALITIPLAYQTADNPDFWGIALWVGVLAFVLVAVLIAGDWYYVAGTFPCYAATFLWWIATGLDGWAGDGLEVQGDQPAAVLELAGGGLAGYTGDNNAGAGAFFGVISTPWAWVWFSTWVSLVCGIILGIISAKVSAAVTPSGE